MQLTKSRDHHVARLNRLIQVALLSGLVLSMALMLIGSLLYFLGNQGAPAIAFGTLFADLAAGNPLAFMVSGIVVLMITPALRVLVAALGYLLEGDWRYALVSLGVVVVLAVSVLIGAV
ncbi:MAG TPA: DUF1634 domain-containing protein [Symbiobacteriaceae bacterium]|nr:DUF1634 domain-containing protein [Symbiobacteriaceae bacterium]